MVFVLQDNLKNLADYAENWFVYTVFCEIRFQRTVGCVSPKINTAGTICKSNDHAPQGHPIPNPGRISVVHMQDFPGTASWLSRKNNVHCWRKGGAG